MEDHGFSASRPRAPPVAAKARLRRPGGLTRIGHALPGVGHGGTGGSPGAGQGVEPRCPVGQPVLSRPRLTSFATPAGFAPRLATPRQERVRREALGPLNWYASKKALKAASSKDGHFARYAVASGGVVARDPGAERDLVSERPMGARTVPVGASA